MFEYPFGVQILLILTCVLSKIVFAVHFSTIYLTYFTSEPRTQASRALCTSHTKHIHIDNTEDLEYLNNALIIVNKIK